MKRNIRVFAALAIVAVPLAGCAPHLKKLDNATRGPYRYANPNGITLPEQPVPSPSEFETQTPVPVPPPAQETAPAPTLPYSVPSASPAPALTPTPPTIPTSPDAKGGSPEAPKPKTEGGQ